MFSCEYCETLVRDSRVIRKVAENIDFWEFCIAFCIARKTKLVDSSLEMLQKIHAKIFFLKWFSGPSGRFSLKIIFESTSRWLLIDRNGLPLLTLCIKRFEYKLLLYFYPLHSGRKLAVHKMIRRRPGLLLNFLSMFNF